jgi:tetratricopeptide (TPR) repeat protein
MRAVIVCVVAALFTMTAPARADGSKRVALVIGNAAYQSLAALGNPRQDAAQLAALLDANGFDVVRCDGQHPGCFDLNRDDLEKALETLRNKADGADVALVFYAGHGMEGRDGNVLAPVDMEVVDCTRLALRRAVPLDELWKAVGGARKKIVILDACRNDPLAQCPAMRGSRPMSFAALTVPESESFLLVSSTKPGQVALDGPAGAHSPYAQSLLQWLQKEPTVYFPDVLSHAAKEVIEETNRANFTQVPEMLVRGELPSACLKGEGCAGDARAAALAQELEALKREHARDQELAAVVRDYLAEAEKSRGRSFSTEERAQERAKLVEAGRALIALNDTRAERALERLKAGDEAEAKRLFAEVVAARKQAAQTARERAAEENREAAKALRQLAAIAMPKNVVEAADNYKEAVQLDPADAQTWVDYGLAAREAGRTDEARAAFEQADVKARASNDLMVRYRAALRLGDMTERETEERYYRAALALAEEAAKTDPDNTAWQRALSVVHCRIGSMLLRQDLRRASYSGQGPHPAALESYHVCLALVDRLAGADPSNSELQRNLATTHIEIGTVLRWQGDYAAALASYQAALSIAERRGKIDPGNDEWRPLLLLVHGEIGHVREEQGDLAEALASMQTTLAISEELAQSDPSNTTWQGAVAAVLMKMGSLLDKQGDRPGALAKYRAELAIRVRLASVDPSNHRYQDELASTHWKIGRALLADSDYTGALASYQEALAIYRRLVTTDPSDGDQEENLAFVEKLIAELLKARGDFAGALASYRAAIDNYGKADSSKALPQSQLSLVYDGVGEILEKQGDLVGALASYRAMQSVAEQTTKLEPRNAFYQGDLELSYRLIGNALKQQGNLGDALGSYRAALAIGEQRSDGGSPEQHRSVGYDLFNIALILLARNDLGGALSSFQAALTNYNELDPDQAATREALRSARYYIGYVLQMQGDLADALASFQAGLAVNQRLASAEPGNADRQLAVWSSHLLIGDVLFDQGHFAEALASYAAAQDIAESRSNADPGDARWKRNLAASYRSVAGVRLAHGDRSGAFALWRKALAIVEASAVAVEQDETKSAGKPGAKTAEALREIGWNALITRDVAKAAAAWERWSTLAPDRWPDVARAHVLLFRNRLREARALYLKYKGKGTLVDGRPWEQVIANDFQALRRDGLARPMMHDVEVALGVAPAQANQSAAAIVHRAGK